MRSELRGETPDIKSGAARLRNSGIGDYLLGVGGEKFAFLFEEKRSRDNRRHTRALVRSDEGRPAGGGEGAAVVALSPPGGCGAPRGQVLIENKHAILESRQTRNETEEAE